MIFSPSWQLDLSENQLCGLDYLGRGTYNAEGITAIADALRVTASLTSVRSPAHQNSLILPSLLPFHFAY